MVHAEAAFSKFVERRAEAYGKGGHPGWPEHFFFNNCRGVRDLNYRKLDFVHLNSVGLRFDKASVKRGEDFFTVGVRT